MTPGTVMLTAEAFTIHCGRCGKAWSIPAGGVDTEPFDTQRHTIVGWFTDHDCERLNDAVLPPDSPKGHA